MARGDVLSFEEFTLQLGTESHNFSSDVLKLGIVDSTITPTIGDATPTWGDYSANEVGTGGGYVADGLTLASVTWTETGGTTTLDAANISLSQDASGFTDAYWGIVYNDTSGTDMAIAFVELAGPVSEVSGPIEINWNASGIIAVARVS